MKQVCCFFSYAFVAVVNDKNAPCCLHCTLLSGRRVFFFCCRHESLHTMYFYIHKISARGTRTQCSAALKATGHDTSRRRSIIVFFPPLRHVMIDKARFFTPKLPPTPPPSSLHTQTVNTGPVPTNSRTRRDSFSATGEVK